MHGVKYFILMYLLASLTILKSVLSMISTIQIILLIKIKQILNKIIQHKTKRQIMVVIKQTIAVRKTKTETTLLLMQETIQLTHQI
jgi:hypothetical protein